MTSTELIEEVLALDKKEGLFAQVAASMDLPEDTLVVGFGVHFDDRNQMYIDFLDAGTGPARAIVTLDFPEGEE